MLDFDCDVFISYAHLDNQTLSKEQTGWIALLHRALKMRLGQFMGEEPSIWRDPKLQGNDRFDDEIAGRVAKAATMVSVLTPRYLKSDWCRKEVSVFISTAENSDSLFINNKSRIFKVVKTPTPLEEHPTELQPLLGYEFFEIDTETQRPREFNPVYKPKIEPEYMAKMDDLAYDICLLLKMIKKAPEKEHIGGSDSGLTVYLAETTSDRSADRDQIRRELEAYGHKILPDRTLPLTGPQMEGAVQKYLQQCKFSIHLIGQYYGVVPEAADRSIIELQNALAGDHSRRQADFFRLIALPKDTKVEDKNQVRFIEQLRNAPDLQPGDDLLETTFDTLKTVIRDRLKAFDVKAERAEKKELTRIYLVYDAYDDEVIAPLEDYLYENKLEVLHPLFDGDEADIIAEHHENLRICDAVLIYYGQAGEAWLRGKIRDLRKAPGYGRAGPMRAKAVYVANPKNSHKERFKTREVDEVVVNFEKFSPGILSSFLGKLRGGAT